MNANKKVNKKIFKDVLIHTSEQWMKKFNAHYEMVSEYGFYRLSLITGIRFKRLKKIMARKKRPNLKEAILISYTLGFILVDKEQVKL